MNLAPFKELIKQRCGLIFSGPGETPLARGLRKRIAATDTKSAVSYLARLQHDAQEFDELVSLLTINETYFYREPEHFKLLVERLIPRILTLRPDGAPLRILSAGCSSGEEPYSIAMALQEKYGESAARLFELAGGDIDKGALSKARSARYSEFSFRGLAPELRERYFEMHGRQAWKVRDDLLRQVHFHHLNLLDRDGHSALRAFDIIFFRNVSIYFDAPTRSLIQQHLAALLKDDGYLIVGTAETLANDLGVLKLVEEDGLFYFSKQALAPLKPRPAPAFVAPHRNAAPERASAPPAARPRMPAMPPTAAAAPVAAPATDIEQALRLTRDKRHEEALLVIAGLLEQRPDASDALLLKAHILLHRKAYAETEEIARRVLHGDAWSTDALVLLGLAAKWRDQPEDALRWFKQAVYASSDCWPAHYYLAELHRAGNEMDKARRSYRVALQLLSAPHTPGDGLALIPLELPLAEVRFLCAHQVAKIDGAHRGTGR